MDFAKAFDLVPRDVIFELAAEAGLPSHILRPLKGMYTQMSRRFRIGPLVGEPFTASNGILQGCPISVCMLNLLMHVWTKLIPSECGGVTAKAYADDAGARAREVNPILEVFAKTREFAELTGMRLNLRKCSIWATSPCLRRALKERISRLFPNEDSRPKLVLRERQLGAQVTFTGRSVGSRDVQQRHTQAEQACDRIRSLPLGLEQKAHLVGSVVGPKLAYDSSVQPMSKKSCQKWRTRISRCLLGDGCISRCNETLLNLFTKGHQVDPWQRRIYESVLTMREQLLKYPETAAKVLRCADMRGQADAPQVWAGPAGQFRHSLQKLGWKWGGGFRMGLFLT